MLSKTRETPPATLSLIVRIALLALVAAGLTAAAAFAGADGAGQDPDGERRVTRAGYLGVMLTPMTPELRAHQGVPEEAGVLVSKVMEDSPAARAGVRVGDVITRVDGEAVATPRDLAAAIRGREDGDVVTLELWRGGMVQNLTAAVEEREGLGHLARRFELRCEGDECEGIEGTFEPYDCGGAAECEVKVLCTGGECDCTVNGETVDCLTIPGPHNR